MADLTLQQLQFLAQNLLQEFRSRGSYGIVKTSDADYPVDGELLRLICHDEELCDKVWFGLNQSYKIGMVGNRASTTHQGTQDNDLWTLGYQYENEEMDLSKYPTYGDVIVSPKINREQTAFIDVLEVRPPSFDRWGIVDDTGFLIENGLTYELSFWYMSEDINSPLTVEFVAEDCDGNEVDLISARNLSPFNEAIDQYRTRQLFPYWNYMSILLYDSSYLTNQPTIQKIASINDGQNFIIPSNVVRIKPRILYDNLPDDPLFTSLFFTDIKFARANLPYSTSFMNLHNFIVARLKNRNSDVESEQLYDYIRKYLIPYNSAFHLTDQE